MEEVISYQKYKNGDISPFGNKIKFIYGRTENIMVYLTEHNSISSSYHSLKIDDTKIILKLRKLENQISSELPEELIDSLLRHLGTVTFAALCANNEDEAIACFKDIESKIKSAKTPEESKVYFLSWSIIYTIVIAVINIAIYYLIGQWKLGNVNYLLCGIAGSFGSCLSIIIRSDKLKLHLLSRNSYIHLQILIKLFVGLFSGIIIFLGSNANLIVGLISSNIYLLIIASIASGFSERIVPEFLEKIDTSK